MKEQYSVLMSVYRKEKPLFLKESIESILKQTKKPFEFVIIKDGKLTQELDDVIEHFIKENPSLFHIIELSENVGLR